MRFLLLVLMLMPAHALATTDGLAGAIVATANATGMSYQFGTRCGVDKNLLSRHKTKFEAEAKAANATLSAGQAVDVDAEFQKGFDEANRFYDAIKDTSQRAMVCQQMTVQIRQAVENPGVLSLPTRGMRSR
jgi:hypothetical protein